MAQVGSKMGYIGPKLANMMGKMREDAKIMRAMLPKLGSGCRPRASWRPSWSEMMRWMAVDGGQSKNAAPTRRPVQGGWVGGKVNLPPDQVHAEPGLFTIQHAMLPP